MARVALALTVHMFAVFSGCDIAPLTVADATQSVHLTTANAVPLEVDRGMVTTNPEAAAASRTVDLGKVMEGGELRHTFMIRNTTDKPFNIIAIKKSCGCETADLREGTTVASGGLLEIGYALSKYGVGRRNGQLVITTDAEEESFRVIELSLRGEIQPKLWATPSELELSADEATSSEQLLRIETMVPGLLDTFQDVSTNRGNVIVRLEEKSDAALTFRVTFAPDAPWGTFYDLIYLAFDHREHRSLNVRVKARKGQPLVLVPPSLALPSFVGAEPQVRKVRIMSPSASAGTFRITKVECSENIVVGELPAELRNACDVHLTFNQPGPIGVEQKVVFHTDPTGCVRLAVRYRQPAP